MSDFFAPVNVNAAEQMTSPAAQPQGLQGRIVYSIQNQNGDSAKIGDQDLMQQLHAAGHNPTGLSPDAQLVSFQDGHGAYQVPMQQVLQKLGWQVTGRDFTDSDRSNVNPALSFAINTPGLQDDSAKRDYLTSYLMHHGIDHPQIEGQGDDWHAFDPQSGKYVALTKGRGAGLDDIAKYGAKAPSFLGSVLGTGLGTAGGPMGMAGGAAGGGFVGGMASNALGSLSDPSAYADALKKQGWQQTATNWAKDAGMDALGGLGAAGIGKVFPGIAKAGLASRAANGAGSVMEAGGDAVSNLAGQASSGLPREMGMALLDPTGATMLGDTMQLPAQAIKGGAALYDSAAPHIGNAIQRMGSHPMAEEMAPGIASRMRDIGQNMRWRSPTSFEGASAEEVLPHGLKGVGKIADSVHNLGGAITAPVRGAYTAGMRGIQGAGKITEGAGALLKHGGQALAPHEMNAINHMGSEELRARLLKRQRDLQLQGVDRKLIPDAQLALEEDAPQPPY